MTGLTGKDVLRAAMLAYARASQAGDTGGQDRALQLVREVVLKAPYEVRVKETPGILNWFLEANADLKRDHGVLCPADFFFAVFGTTEKTGILQER
jgi:hypothetical protein